MQFLEGLAYHHGIPAISRLITAEQCDSIEAIKQNSIFAIADAVGELHLIAGESTIAPESSRRIVLNRLNQADTLVEIRARDECESDQLHTVSTTVLQH